MAPEEEPTSQMQVDDPPSAVPEAAGEEGEEGAEGTVEDAEAKAALLASLPEVSLDLFDLIKSAQGQHGLRHGDYGRYRQYCSRRLHRLRRVLKFQHGTKGRFAKRVLEPVLVKDSRHLMLPLFCAERAWSLAMQLKRDKSSQEESRPRYHLLHRLAKAAKWSALLAELSQVRGDQRTALEAEAYAAFMAGNNHLEREQWAPALAAFRRTARICSELCRVSLVEQAHLYRQMVAEVNPSIRFCTYNLRRAGELPEGADEEGDDVEVLADAEDASDILRSKLEHVLQETRSKQAKSMTDVEVLGGRVPIKSDKTRVCMLRAQELLLEVEGAATSDAPKAEAKAGDVMSLYDQLFVAFNDSLESVRAELRQVGKEHTAKAELAEAQLLRLQASLHWQKLHHTARRTLLLVQRLRAAAGGGERGSGEGKEGKGGEKRKRTTPEDLVRLYDSVLGTLADMSQLDLYKEHELLMGKLAARSASAKAFRCFYVAESYAAADKWREAQALYGRSAKLLADALALHAEYAAPHAGPESEGCAAGIGEDGAALALLESLIDGARARAHAQAVLTAADGPPAVAEAAKDVARLRLQGNGKGESAAAGVPLLSRLDQFLAKDPNFLIDFPPKLEAVPCKPLLFDMARNEIRAPDLGARIKSKRSTWGSWFGRG